MPEETRGRNTSSHQGHRGARPQVWLEHFEEPLRGCRGGGSREGCNSFWWQQARVCTRVTLAAFCGHSQHSSADASAPRKGHPSLSPSAQGQPLQPGQVAGSSELTFSGFQARCVAHGPPCTPHRADGDGADTSRTQVGVWGLYLTRSIPPWVTLVPAALEASSHLGGRPCWASAGSPKGMPPVGEGLQQPG